METIFIKLLNMSITAGWLILAVVLLRAVLKRAPKSILCVLWALVGIRLICPFSIESMFSAVPSAETVPQSILYSRTPAIDSGIEAINESINPILSQSLAPDMAMSVNPAQVIAFAASAVWIAGMAAIVLYTLISYLRLRGRVATAVRLKDNIWQSEAVTSPFVLGVFKPRIYLPFNMDEESMRHVIAHETAHIKRRDHWIKPAGFLLLTIYWFNPLIWLAYSLMCRDIELACDEQVIKALDEDEKRAYSTALLACSVNRRAIAACPLAFGEVGVKQRIKNVLNYKKPAFWIIAAAIASCLAVAVLFMTDPKPKKIMLSSLSENECVEFIKARGVDIPEGFDNGDLGEFVKGMIISVEEDPYNNKYSAVSFTVIHDFAKEIQRAVNEYHGIESYDTGDLFSAVSAAIIEANSEGVERGGIPTSAYSILKIVHNGDKLTVYAAAMYNEYIYEDGALTLARGSHMPVAITFHNDKGELTPVEYWVPQDGSEYSPSIRKKFPSDIYDAAMKLHDYADLHERGCYEQALEHVNGGMAD